MSVRAYLKGLAAVLLLCSLGTPAAAQEIGQDALGYLGTFAFSDSLRTWDQVKDYSGETVLDHTRDGFIPVGIRLPGGHLLFPSMQAKTIYDDNLFRSPIKVGELRSSLAANAELQSNLSRHMFKVTVGGETVDFKDHKHLNFTNGTVRGDLRLDLDAADSIGASFSSQLSHDDSFLPPAPDVVAAAVPVWTNRAAIGYMHDAGRTALAVGADYQRTYVYDTPTYSGDIADESKGDNDVAGAFALLTYRFSPGYKAFAAGRIDRQLALHERAAYSNNNTYKAEAGVSYELNPLLKFNLTAGYTYVKFDTDLQYNFGTSIFKGSLQWLPTRRLTVTLDASRQLQRTVVGPEFGQLSDTAQLRLQYDVYHNIIGRIDTSLQRNQFIGSTRVDTVWSAGASFDYLFNENLALTLGVEHTERASSDPNFAYDDNRIMATVKLSQ
jgi:hypothetical protein